MFTLKKQDMYGYQCYEAKWYRVTHDDQGNAHVAYSSLEEHAPDGLPTAAAQTMGVNKYEDCIYVTNSLGRTVDRIVKYDTVSVPPAASRI